MGDLVAGDLNGWGDIFVRDTCEGAPESCRPSTMLVSVASNGSQSQTAGSYGPSISDDGRIVVFSTQAKDLVPGCTTGTHVVWHDRDPDGNGIFDEPGHIETRCLPAPEGGHDPYISGSHLAISSTGRYVAFVSFDADLVPDDTNDGSDIFLHDTCFGALPGCKPSTIRVSVASDGSEGRWTGYADLKVYSTPPSLSADGRYVVFGSIAKDLVPDDTNYGEDVFLRDTCIGAAPGCLPSTERVSKGDVPVQFDGGTKAVISANGRYIAFIATGKYVLVRDTCRGASDPCIPVTVNASPTYDGAGLYDGTREVAISPDGRFVEFLNSAGNIVPEDTNNAMDAFLRDTCLGALQDCTPQTIRISMAMDGTQANGDSGYTQRMLGVGNHGSTVVFASDSTNLLPEAKSGSFNIFRSRVKQ